MNLAFTPEETQLRNEKRSETNRLGRTKDEERRHNETLEMTDFWGLKFGEVVASTAGKTVRHKLTEAHGAFEEVMLHYNVSNQLFKVVAVVNRKDYAEAHGISEQDAGEILHREIVKVCREIEDKQKINCLANTVGDDLTEKSRFKIDQGFLSEKMYLNFREDKQQISFTIIHLGFRNKLRR